MKHWSCDSPATFDVTWRAMTWRDMMWHYVTWPDVTLTWQDVTWHDMTWHDVTLRGMTWHEVHDMAWHNEKLRDMTRNYMTWCNMTWHDVAWRDMAIKLTIKRWSCDRPATFARLLINLVFLLRNECLDNLEKPLEPEGDLNFWGLPNMVAQEKCHQMIRWPQKHKWWRNF